MFATASGQNISGGIAQQLVPQPKQPSRNLAHELNDLIQRIYQSDSRERALSNLAKKADEYPSVGYIVWNKSAIIPIFLHEIIAGYPLLKEASKPLKPALNRVSNVLTMLQRIAGDERAWKSMVESGIVRYLLPYLKVGNSAVDHVRVNALGVIGMLTRHNSSEGIRYLVHDLGIFPYCLDSISLTQDSDKGAGKIIAAFVLEKLLQHEGLNFIREVPERCKRVVLALCKAVPLHPQDEPMKKLARNCIRCFICLCREEIGRVLLQEMLPSELLNRNFDFNDEGLNKVVRELHVALG